MSGRGEHLIRRVIRGTNHWMRLQPRMRVEISPQISDLLSKPSWSICTLLPEIESEKARKDYSMTPEKLRHLLKLSALPPPKSAAEEQAMLQTLEAQIHFVKEIQKIETHNVEPLIAIRDETKEAASEEEVTLAKLKPWLDLETQVGKNGTVRRRPKQFVSKPQLLWDPFALGPARETRQKGKYFFVKRQKRKLVPASVQATSGNPVNAGPATT